MLQILYARAACPRRRNASHDRHLFTGLRPAATNGQLTDKEASSVNDERITKAGPAKVGPPLLVEDKRPPECCAGIRARDFDVDHTRTEEAWLFPESPPEIVGWD